MQQADGHRVDCERSELGDRRLDVLVGQRLQHLAVRADPLEYTDAPVGRHQRGGFCYVQVVNGAPRLPPDLQYVLESCCRYEGRSRALSFEQSVGCHRRPVYDVYRLPREYMLQAAE